MLLANCCQSEQQWLLGMLHVCMQMIIQREMEWFEHFPYRAIGGTLTSSHMGTSQCVSWIPKVHILKEGGTWICTCTRNPHPVLWKNDLCFRERVA